MVPKEEIAKKYYTEMPQGNLRPGQEKIYNHVIPEERTEYLMNQLLPKSRSEEVERKREEVLMVPKS